ncbi:MAG: hypothetical protein WC716_01980 [Chitinophagaceae bacterium]|jgi:hypothetical protein
MKKLRSFVYLDNYKMYSISSQLFEGLTDYIVKTERKNSTEKEEQKGPFGSGQVLASILEIDTNETEKKFLHDYSYNIFEDALIQQNKVLEINSENITQTISVIGDFSFVKITGNVIFNDLKIIEDTIRNFNQTGEAFGYITYKDLYDEELNKFKDALNSEKNQKNRADILLKVLSNFKSKLRELGLNLDEEYLRNLAYIISYGYNQHFEVQLPLKASNDYFLFSAQLKRANLKDDEFSIIKKYSRETEKKFTLFGILTQKLKSENKLQLFKDLEHQRENPDVPNMKEGLKTMISFISSLEKTFTGKLDYEYVVDPISLYLEI